MHRGTSAASSQWPTRQTGLFGGGCTCCSCCDTSSVFGRADRAMATEESSNIGENLLQNLALAVFRRRPGKHPPASLRLHPQLLLLLLLSVQDLPLISLLMLLHDLTKVQTDNLSIAFESGAPAMAASAPALLVAKRQWTSCYLHPKSSSSSSSAFQFSEVAMAHFMSCCLARR